MRLLLRPAIKVLVIATALAGSAAIALLIIGYPQRPWLVRREVQPVALALSAGTENAPEFSLFDRSRELPEIRFSDAENRPVSLADFRGKVVLLNIWATWCVPCRKEMPSLDRLEGLLGGKDFIVLPLSMDRTGVPAIKRFYENLDLHKLQIYVDVSGQAARALGIPGLPTTLLIKRDGREIARKMGAAEWDSTEMVALIRGSLDARPDTEKAMQP